MYTYLCDMPSTVFLCLYLPSPPHHQMHDRPARLSRFRIMTFSIQQAKRFYYRPGSPATQRPTAAGTGCPNVGIINDAPSACMYVYCIHYLRIPIYNTIPAATLPIHIIYLYVYCVCRLHLAASQSSPPPHHH